jgi:hypothetical protein
VRARAVPCPLPALRLCPPCRALQLWTHHLHQTQHKLQNKWSFFYNNPKANPMLSWEEKLQKVYTFDTVEDFWA